MALSLEQLMAKDKSELTSFEEEVVAAQNRASAIRQEIEAKGIRLIQGVAHRVGEEPEQSSEEFELEIESMGLGYIALGRALEYLTQEKTVPLTEQQYFELKTYAESNYPKSMWDKGLWFKRFNKVVNEWDIPVNDDVLSYMGENDRLLVQTFFQETEALRKDIPFEEAGDAAFQMSVIHLWPIHGPAPTYEEFEAKLKEAGMDCDARQLYEAMRQLNSPAEEE